MKILWKLFILLFLILFFSFIIRSMTHAKIIKLSRKDLYKYNIHKLLNKNVTFNINFNDVYYIRKVDNIGYSIVLKDGTKYSINSREIK